MNDTPIHDTTKDYEEVERDVEEYSEEELDNLHYDMSEVPLYYDHG